MELPLRHLLASAGKNTASEMTTPGNIDAVDPAIILEACLEGFEYIQTCLMLSEGHEPLLCKLDIQKQMLCIWGEEVGLMGESKNTMAGKLLTRHVRHTMKIYLDCIRQIFEDTDQLSKKYGLPGVQVSAPAFDLEGQIWENRTELPHPNEQRNIAARHDLFCHDIKEYSAALKELTNAIAPLKKQKDTLVDYINSMSDIDSLAIYQEATEKVYPEVSKAATSRIAALTHEPSSSWLEPHSPKMKSIYDIATERALLELDEGIQHLSLSGEDGFWTLSRLLMDNSSSILIFDHTPALKSIHKRYHDNNKQVVQKLKSTTQAERRILSELKTAGYESRNTDVLTTFTVELNVLVSSLN